MATPRGTEASQRRRPPLAALGGLLAATGLVAFGVGLAGQQPAPPPAPDIPAASSTAQSSVPTTASARPRAARSTPSSTPPKKRPAHRAAPAALPESVPETLTIPTIDVSARFVDLGLTDTGELETPADPARVGWFTGGHTPGSPGVAVVAGHVTWNRAPTVFFDLGRLRRGDAVTIHRADGSSATFAVTRRSTFAKDQFPTAEVYRASDTPELVLITCGGRYSSRDHSYDSNIIVWAQITSIKAA